MVGCCELEPCAAELCVVECRAVWLAAVAQCYSDHPCDSSDAQAEEWMCKQPAIDDARDCLAMCTDAAAGQACVDGMDEATMACEPSPFD